MSIAHLLEDFGDVIELASVSAPIASEEATEVLRLEAYEDGYKAGWDDAVGANQAEQMQVAADLAQNLRDMSFTYQEACTHVIGSLTNVFDAMFAQFLPELSRIAIAPKVAEELQKLPLNADDMRVVLSVAPDNIAIMKRLADRLKDIEVSVVEDRSLTAGQVQISFADGEMALDFDALLEELRDAIEAFNHSPQKEQRHV
ncbi:FliH/SctL family protein [Primorskyibacter sp. S187A]|uniref:FliH/SctL family protein n=1 Tax=Primorskyibacter sp. S187A TaxID=3415130 RepID=UPI003C79B151